MHRILRLLFACLLAPVLHAAIAGYVVAPDGTGVAGARIIAYRPLPPVEERKLIVAQAPRPELATGTTDAEGTFTLDPGASGMVELRVERDGFAPAAGFVLNGNQAAVVELTAAAKRTGHVTAGGKPVKGARVIATRDLMVLWTAVTAEDGTYAIADPASWATELSIVHPGATLR